MFRNIEIDSTNPNTIIIIWPNKLIYFILAILAVSLIVVQLVMSNHLATQGQELLSLRQYERGLIEENLSLKRQIAQESSLTAIGQKAAKLKMVKASNFLYIDKSVAVALNQ